MRLAILADIHGNLLALEAVLADLEGFAPDLTVDLGDCVSGPLWPRETLERLESLNWPTVRGNHDRAVALDAPATMGASDRFAYGQLTAAQRRRLGELPFRCDFASDIVGFHATPSHDDRYLLDRISDGRLARAAVPKIGERLGGTRAALILCGHSHRQELIQLEDGRTILNPGSVGCPAYDDPTGQPHVSESGSPHARYAIADLIDGRLSSVTFRALAYDHEAAARRAKANGRPDWADGAADGLHAVRGLISAAGRCSPSHPRRGRWRPARR